MGTSIVLFHHDGETTRVIYRLCSVYVHSTTNPSMFYVIMMKHHSSDQRNHVLMNGYFSISNSYTLCNVYIQSTTNPSMFYKTTVKNHSLDQHGFLHTLPRWKYSMFKKLFDDDANWIFQYKFVIVSYTSWSWFVKSFNKPESFNKEIFFSYWWVLPLCCCNI